MKKRNDYVVIIIIFATILVIGYLIFFNIKKNSKIEVEAIVKEIGNNYLIVVDDNDNEYLLNVDDNYESGDKINFVLKNVKKGSPITGDVLKIDTISKNVVFSVTDISEDNDESNSNVNQDYTNVEKDDNANKYSENVTTDDSNDNIIIDDNTDAGIISYFTEFSNEVDNSSEFKSSIKEKFVLIVDFLFYDGTIKGKTFKELSNLTKLKVLQLFLKVDNKIETKFPNYKESISSTGNKVYTNAKNKAIETYLDITTDICSNDPGLCDVAKEGLSDLKNNFSLTWDFIKKISGVGLSKLKSWYEIWREV